MKKNTVTFSLILALFIGTINAVDFSLHTNLFRNFALATEDIFGKLEFWRLFSYPFFFNSVEGIFLFLAIFIFVSPRLEYFLGRTTYPLLLFLSSFVIGAITTIVFNDSNIVVGGMEGLSFFVFTVFVMLLVKDKHIVNKQPFLSIGIFAVVVWCAFKYILAASSQGINIFPSIVSAAVGVSIGLLVYLQMHFLIKSRIKKAKMRMKPIKYPVSVPNSEELTISMLNNPDFKETLDNLTFIRIGKSKKEDDQLSDIQFSKIKKILEEHAFFVNDEANEIIEEYDSDENQLDVILDKINVTGQDSLTAKELNFLSDYSKKI
ncbi:hypothetical protein SDC9_92849 [bioreactor metagenome]|uniref:Uncharacterized protein n=1 Tax=bioreactor metagenome TaxID=1076179 RepID=A0A645A1N0_9ZZZZ